jgi:hypothetical protein
MVATALALLPNSPQAATHTLASRRLVSQNHGGQDLEGDILAEPLIVGAEHHALATAADLFDQPEVTELLPYADRRGRHGLGY